MISLAVDLDGTLIQYDDGEYYPIPGVQEAIQKLREQGYFIIIHTCRTGIAKKHNCLSDEVAFIESILNKFGIEYDQIYIGEKLVADFYIDDRAIPFKGDWQEVTAELNNRIEQLK